MGCAESKIEIEIQNNESVCRCKDSLHFLKEAIAARKAFASGHFGYAMALKNIGSAFTDFAHGEAEELYHTRPPPPPSPPPAPLPPPPPPPLPSFSPTPLQRSVSMPVIPVAKKGGRKINNGAILEEDEDEDKAEEEEEDREHDLRLRKRRKSDGRMATVDETPSPMAPPPPPESKGMAWDYYFNTDLSEDDDDDQHHDEEPHHLSHHQNHHITHHQVEPKTPGKVDETPSPMAPPPPPESMMSWDYFFPTLESISMPRINLSEDEDEDEDDDDEEEEEEEEELHHLHHHHEAASSLLKTLNEIDDHFLMASESAHEVSKMLEATTLHYNSIFDDNRGHIDHAARVMHVKGMPSENGNDEYDEDGYDQTHATVLYKLLAWEKKLYEEVKAGELMKLEYQRKLALLNKLKKRSAGTESLEKTKAAVSRLHTRYIVDMQSLDSTVSKVNDIRDKQLFPKLVALVDGMSTMWDKICKRHDNQLRIASYLKSLDVSGAPKETTKHHYEITVQLYHVVQGWHSHFETLVTHQKHYIQALNNWLKLNLLPIESSLKEIFSSPTRIQIPPIQMLLHSWDDHLQKLPDELAKNAITSFAAVIETIISHQEEEMKLEDKLEETRKEYLRKSRAFEDWYHEYMMRRGPQEETGVTGTDPKDPIAERRFVVDLLKKRLEDEAEAHRKLCVQVRDISLGSLKTRLPELFRAMSDYAHVCRDSYQRLNLTCISRIARTEV